MTLALQQQLQEKVTERIRASFLELLPEEAFDTMVGAAMQEFLQGSPMARRGLGYNPMNDPNTFPGMVMLGIKEHAKKLILDYLGGPDFQTIWSNSGPVASDVVKDLIKDNADTLVASLFGSILTNAMMHLRTSIQQQPRMF